MKLEIEIKGKGKAIAELDQRNPETARQIYENLPLTGSAKLWLEEVYFETSLNIDYEKPSSTASKGDLSYWPPGSAFCIFYGESQPASAVNHIGQITDNLELFTNVAEDDEVIIRKI